MSSKKTLDINKMSSKNSQVDSDTKSLKQRQQAEFYAIGVKESNTVVKSKPPTVKDVKTNGLS